MCVYKRATTRSKLHFAAFVAAAISTIIIGGNASAATTTGGIITEGNARWEYSLKTDGDNQELSIMFYDKDPDATTITVPSLADLTDGSVPGITATLDTYFLKNADTAAQTTAYEATYPRRTATATTNKLDMTNTSKIQILGVKPIIDPNTETELVFGENMVIGDSVINKKVRVQVCTKGRKSKSGNRWYYGCDTTEYRTFTDFESNIPNWDAKTDEEKTAYVPTLSDIGCLSTSNINASNWEHVQDGCYAYSIPQNLIETVTVSRAFSDYKLKLTNFVESNFNYIGGMSFKNSIFNEANTTMTIEGDAFWGIDIFANTNITKAIIKTETIGAGIFRDCANLSEVMFDSSVTKVTDDAFAGSGLTSISFEGTNIKTIGPRAFYGANLTSVNLNGVNRISFAAFGWNKFTELYLPKSLNYLEASIFGGNRSLKKLTIAYDTLTSGTTLPLHVNFSDYYGYDYETFKGIEEIEFIAPYAADEQVSDTHVAYNEYKYHYSNNDQSYVEDMDVCHGNWYNCMNTVWSDYNYYDRRGDEPGDYRLMTDKYEDDYANVDSYKNVLAPIYASYYSDVGLKKITIGEGYQFVGSGVFYNSCGDHGSGDWEYSERTGATCHIVNEINLPESLKGVGNMAFAYVGAQSSTETINIPQGLEFVGISAFLRNYNATFDLDLSDLKYLGDYAFAGTKIHNIALRDKIYYMGINPFFGTPNVNDVTFDFDVFNPELKITWAEDLTKRNDYWFKGQAHTYYPFRFAGVLFGMAGTNSGYIGRCDTETKISSKGFACDEYYPGGGSTNMKFGTITFTEKVQHEFPGFIESPDRLEWFIGNRDGLPNQLFDSFFSYGFIADKIDMSKAGWKVLPPNLVTYDTKIGEMILPENLEVISHSAFVDAWILNDLVIPDSVKVIGDAAFTVVAYASNPKYEPVTIKSLPSSLEYIGAEAFYNMRNLSADLNASNLYYVGIRAFQGTKLRDVLIPEGVTVLREGTFANIPTLRNITIDTDFGAAVTNPVDRSINALHAPQSLLNCFGGTDEEKAARAWRYIIARNLELRTTYEIPGYYDDDGHWVPTKYGTYDMVGKDFETFYTIFNQTMKSAQGTYGGDNGGQETSGEHYGNIIFTDKNVTDIPTSGPGKGVFSWLTYDKFDMAATDWTTLTAGVSAFEGATIGELTLPHNLVNMNSCAFQRATVAEPFSIPGSVEEISGNAFQWAKLGGITFNDGTKTIGTAAFEFSETSGDITLPNTLETIAGQAFLQASGHITNMLPDSVKTIGGSAFFGSDMADDVIIPGSVKSIGGSAFNAGPADVHYDTVTIEPDLTTQVTGELVHQMFWNAKMDKMTIKSNRLVGYEKPDSEEVTWGDETRTVYYEEFWHMPFEEIEITNLPTITYAAFRNCEFLKKVDMGKNTNLRTIRDLAFKDDEKLEQIIFAPGIKDETVVINESAFENTGFKTVGKAGSDFNLNAAHFDAAPKVFMNGKKITKVEVPETYSNGTLPEKTFANAPELTEATIDYRVKRIDNAAFSNDNKLKRIFIWGNTIVMDENLPDYRPPVLGGMGEGGSESGSTETFGPTIPEGTDIYAYSTSPTESYAAFNGRESFDGTFYPLDEVLYLTTNKTYVKIDDNKDFDKNGLTVYGLRRDGMVVESDSWAEYDDNSYSRHDAELTFAKMEPTIEENPDFGTVWDTPVPKAELNFANVNFETIDYELVEDPEGPEGVKLINIIYTDKYTDGKPDTDVLPYTEPPVPIPVPVPDSPVTSAINIFAYIASFGAASGVLAVVIRNKLARSRR